MGGVAVLQPQDLFNHQRNLISPAMKTHSLRRNPAAVNRSSHRRKRSPEKNTRSRLQSPAKPPTVMGQVKILRRGETLPLFSDPKVDEETITSTSTSTSDDENTEKDLVRPPKKQILTIYDCYAGTAFVTSPPPSSLPVPAFFKKKNLVLTNDKSSNNNNNDPTSDILRLLRLDLS